MGVIDLAVTEDEKFVYVQNALSGTVDGFRVTTARPSWPPPPDTAPSPMPDYGCPRRPSGTVFSECL
jgi:hypothetical protein